MRISTALIHQQAMQSLGLQQTELAKVQQQMNTGQRIVTSSDDPSGMATVLAMRESIDTHTQYQSNIDQASARLQLAENAISSVNDQLQRALEIVVQGNSDSYNDKDRLVMAKEARHILDSLQGLANSKDQTGDYLFAGGRSQTQPFIMQTNGSVSYQGDDTVRMLQIGATREIAAGDGGKDFFMAIRSGNGTFSAQANVANTGTGVIAGGSLNGTFVPDDYNLNFSQPIPGGPITYQVLDSASAVVSSGTYTSGVPISFSGVDLTIKGTPANGDQFQVNRSRNQSVFTTLQNMINALEAPTTTAAQQASMHNQLAGVLSDLDQAMNKMGSATASLGARQATLDAQKEVNDTLILHNKTVSANIEDLDYAEAISRFSRQMAGLEALQKTYTQLQGLSLFKYI